jgi:hypothetical protein
MFYAVVFLGLDVLFALGLGAVIAQQRPERDGKRRAAEWPAVDRRHDGAPASKWSSHAQPGHVENNRLPLTVSLLAKRS